MSSVVILSMVGSECWLPAVGKTHTQGGRPHTGPVDGAHVLGIAGTSYELSWHGWSRRLEQQRGACVTSKSAPFGSHSLAQQVFSTHNLGEQLHPKVHKQQPVWAGKIRGMLLELSEKEITNLAWSDAQLEAKVQEAMKVLQPSCADKVKDRPSNYPKKAEGSGKVQIKGRVAAAATARLAPSK